MTPDGTTDQVGMASQAAQHDDPTPTPVCPASPEGAMPLQSATLSHKKIPLSEIEALAAAQGRWRHGQATTADVELINRSSQKVATAAHCLNVGRGLASPDTEMVVPEVLLDASKLPDWKDLDLRPGNVWQMKPEPKLESYEGIPAEVINEARILGSDAPHRIIEKLEEQMKGKWVMVRMGQPVAMKMVSEPEKVSAEEEAHRWAASLRGLRLQVNPNDFGYILTWEVEPGIARYATVQTEVCERAIARLGLTSTQADKQVFDHQSAPLARAVAVELYLEVGQSITRSVDRACAASVPEEMVNVRGEQRPVDEYCVATPVRLDHRSKNAQRMLEVMHDCDKMAQEATGMPLSVPSRDEALAMRDMVEKAAEAMRGRGASMPERSYLSLPRQHDSPLSARVVPASEAPDPKVGW